MTINKRLGNEKHELFISLYLLLYRGG